MPTKDVPKSSSIVEVKLPRLVDAASILYEFIQFYKRWKKGVSNGPLEVGRSLADAKKAQHIVTLSSSELPTYSRIWVGFGKLTTQVSNEILASSPKRVVLGPNLDIHDIHVREILENIPESLFLVPATWVKDYYTHVLGINSQKIEVWAAGIDVNHWVPAGGLRPLVLIYVKEENEFLVKQFTCLLSEKGIKTAVIRYGSYSQSTYKRLLNQSKFAIFLIGTESQGLAQFQAWSMDVPTLVLRRPTYFDYRFPDKVIPASSSPYLSDETGQFFESSTAEVGLEEFMNKLANFTPRQWVLQNYSRDSAAIRFLNLFD